MHSEIHLGSYGLSISFGRYQKVRGICSQLENGNHFLMWDFDGTPLKHVSAQLRFAQVVWDLPSIHIIRSSEGDKYHAFCFASYPVHLATQIIAATPSVDSAYLALGLLRGYWTLRITNKTFRAGFESAFEHIKVLPGHRAPDVKWNDCHREVTYWTRLD